VLSTIGQAKPEPAAAGAGALIASLGSLGGQPITPSIVPEGAFGEDRIRAALS
jgi:hypothetical protein